MTLDSLYLDSRLVVVGKGIRMCFNISVKSLGT